MDEALKEIGIGLISLANMLLVIMFLNHIFLGNIELNSGNISLMIYIFTIIYFSAIFLIKIGREKERKNNEY